MEPTKKKMGRPKKVVADAPAISSEEVLAGIGISLPEVEVAGVGWVGDPIQVVPETLQNALQGEKTPHPYVADIRRPNDVPEAYRDENYNVSEAKIDAFLQRCWDIQTVPIISGVMIGTKV